MHKSKNILLAVGVILFVFDACLMLIFNQPWNAEPNWHYFRTQVLISSVSIFLLGVLPTILLVLNLKNKYSKSFTIIASIVSGLLLIYHSISSVISAVPAYLIFSKLGLVDSIWVYLLDKGGKFRLLGCILVTIGSILSIRLNKKES